MERGVRELSEDGKKCSQGNLISKKIEGFILIVVLILIKLPIMGSLFGLFCQCIQQSEQNRRTL